MDQSLKTVSWNITRKCNLQCLNCYLPVNLWSESASDPVPDNELSTQQALLLIDQIAGVNNRVRLILAGGEPLLRQDIFTLAAYAFRKGMTVHIETNGMLLMDSMILKSMQSGISGIIVTLDSMNPLIHDSERLVHGSWSRTVQAIKKCKHNGMTVHLRTVINENNWKELPELIDFAHSLQTDEFSPFFMTCSGKEGRNTDIKPDQYYKVLREVKHARTKYPDMIIQSPCSPDVAHLVDVLHDGTDHGDRDRQRCVAGLHLVSINAEGDVTPCSHIQESAGNVLKVNFEDIWRKSPLFSEIGSSASRAACAGHRYNRLCGSFRNQTKTKRMSGIEKRRGNGFQYADNRVQPSHQLKEMETDDGAVKIKHVIWSMEADRRLSEVPEIIRSMVRSAIENYALQNECREITPEVMDKASQDMEWKN